MTNAEIRACLASVDPAAVRCRAGFTLRVIAEACGTGTAAIWAWENRRHAVRGPAGARYARVIAGLARHLEIPEDPR